MRNNKRVYRQSNTHRYSNRNFFISCINTRFHAYIIAYKNTIQVSYPQLYKKRAAGDAAHYGSASGGRWKDQKRGVLEREVAPGAWQMKGVFCIMPSGRGQPLWVAAHHHYCAPALREILSPICYKNKLARRISSNVYLFLSALRMGVSFSLPTFSIAVAISSSCFFGGL